jgi:rhomboid protease GluP
LNSKKFFDSIGLNGTRWQWRMMLWEKKIKQSFRSPVQGGGLPFTQLLIALNLLSFAIMVVQGGMAGLNVFKVIVSPDPYLLIHSGAQFWPLVLADGEWWRLLTYAFMHGGILHLLFNMVALYQIGPLIESEIGRSRFLILYTFTAVTATLADLLWHANVPVVGASGALLGLIGFAVVWYHRLGGYQALELRNFMLKWAAFTFIFGILVGADNAAHLGGALGGAAIGFILPMNSWTRRKTDKFCTVLAWVCALLIVAAFAGLALSWLR